MSARPKLNYCASDNEVFELLMSSKRGLKDTGLHDLARERKIFYSPRESREDLVAMLALLPYDSYYLERVMDMRGSQLKMERSTNVMLPVALSADQIKAIMKAYQDAAPEDERVLIQRNADGNAVMKVHYEDVDYSKTRLLSRTPREADITVEVEGDTTKIRMPANSKAQEIFASLKADIDGRLKQDVPARRIEIPESATAEDRTKFFTALITKLPQFKLQNVKGVRVEPINKHAEEEEISLEETEAKEEIEQEALSLVRNVALSGENVLLSAEFQALVAKGFFVTYIKWRGKLTVPPYPIVEFDAAFEEPHAGKRFKYKVRGLFNAMEAGEYASSIRHVADADKQRYLSMIEDTAVAILVEMAKLNSPDVGTQ